MNQVICLNKGLYSTGGFEVALEEEEGRTGEHGGEVIGWLAVEAGTGTVNGHPYEAGHTADAVKDAWYTIGFAQAFSQGPRFVAGLASCDGWDSAAVRYKRSSLSASSVQVKVEEDTAYDSESNHTSEVVAWWAIQGDGRLTEEMLNTSWNGIEHGLDTPRLTSCYPL